MTETTTETKTGARGHRLGNLDTPDITQAQVLALLESIVAVAAALGFHLSDSERQALIGLAGVVAAFLMGADAFIRNGRAKASAAREQFQAARGDVREAFGRGEKS
jgi:hypothetical protein